MKLLKITSILFVLLLISSLGFGQICDLKINDNNPGWSYTANIALYDVSTTPPSQVNGTFYDQNPLSPTLMNVIYLPWQSGLNQIDSYMLYVTIIKNGGYAGIYYSQSFSGAYYASSNPINVIANIP